MRKGMCFLICFLAMIFMQGCADFEKQAYTSVLAAGKTYDISMKTAARLYEEKKITEEQKTKILAVGTVYYGAYQASVEAMLVYHDAKDKDAAKDKARQAVTSMILRFNTFIDCYNDIVKGIEGLNPETKLEELKE